MVDLDSLVKGQTVRKTLIDGVEIPYTVTGAGPALLLVPGTGPTSQLQFGTLVEDLASYNSVITVDLSGMTPVLDDGSPLSLDQLAAQLVGVLDDAEIGRVSLFGFSLGSAVAIRFAANNPDRVDKLILVAGWANTNSNEYLRNFFLIWRQLAIQDNDLLGRFSTLTGFSEHYLTQLGPDAVEQIVPNLKPDDNLRRQIDLGSRVDVRGDLEEIKAETLVISCERDATIPASNSEFLADAIAGAKRTSIDSGHVAPMENPSALMASVREFLA